MSDDPIQGIRPAYEAFYIEAMLFCTKSAASSVNSINDCLSRADRWEDDPSQREQDTDIILDNFQNIAAQGAALSRYLWPSRNREPHASRALHLRESLGIADDSALHDRELRNQMEHFDEILDRYLENGIVGHILPKYVGPFPGEQEVPAHLFRAYYVDISTFEVLGKRYAMQPIAEQIAQIHDQLVACSESGFRLRARHSK